jgi:hypothetical protein
VLLPLVPLVPLLPDDWAGQIDLMSAEDMSSLHDLPSRHVSCASVIVPSQKALQLCVTRSAGALHCMALLEQRDWQSLVATGVLPDVPPLVPPLLPVPVVDELQANAAAAAKHVAIETRKNVCMAAFPGKMRGCVLTRRVDEGILPLAR